MLESLEGKTVLVTGGKGFIGKHLLRRLCTIPDLKVIALTRKLDPLDSSASSVHWVEGALGDLTTGFWLQHDIKQIDCVFQLGAYTPKSSQEANNLTAAYADNLHGTWRLLESLPNVPERIVYASTLDVYEPVSDQGSVISEKTRLIPSSLYGASKLFCEQMVMDYASRQSCAYSILRYGHIYGPGEMAYRKFIPELIRKLIAGESPVIYGDGSTLRDFLYIDDVIEATLRAAAHSSAQLGPINIVRGESVTLREIQTYLTRYAGKNIQPQYLLDKSGGVSMRFDNTLMTNLLGCWNLTRLEQGLQLEYDHAKQFAL